MNLSTEYAMFNQKNLTCYWGNRDELTDKQRKIIKELLSNLAKVPKCNAVLEADVSVLGASLTDKKYDRPANPALLLLGDANTGTVIKFEMVGLEDDAIVMLAEILIGFIFQYGAPKEIRVSNVIVEAGLEQICNVCGIKLRRVKRLQRLDEFIQGMYHRYSL